MSTKRKVFHAFSRAVGGGEKKRIENGLNVLKTMISVILQAGTLLGSHRERQTVFRGSVAGKKRKENGPGQGKR